MSDKMLIAIDGSESSKRALDFAARNAQATGASLVLAYVIEWSPYSFHTPEELAERHQRRESEIERAHSIILAPKAKVLRDAGLSVETVVDHGHIGKTLAELAHKHDASQIYIGRQGESKMHAMLFGSVTANLIQTATVPVIVVP